MQLESLPMTTLAVARSMLRVNHAGELTARRIYEGQLAVLRVLDPETVPLVQVTLAFPTIENV